MHTKYERNCFIGSWDMQNYVFFTFGDLVSKVKVNFDRMVEMYHVSEYIDPA